MKKVSVNVLSQKGEVVGKLDLNGDVFGVKVNNQVMFDAVQVYQANMRQATAKTKTRDCVSGGGKKPWRQKGTGRARAGSTRSPIWVGGGVAFGPDGRQNYTLQQNRKEYRLALKSALTLKVENGLVVVDSLTVGGKTKEMIEVLKALKAEGKTILVTNDDLVAQAANNLPAVLVRGERNISVYDLLNADHLVITQDAIKSVEEALK